MSRTTQESAIKWSEEDRARHQAIREKFQRERPTQEELLATGDYTGPLPHGAYLDFLEAMCHLKKEREAQGLSLADGSARCGIDRAALSRLENGQQPNPTLETILRYAAALGKRLVWSFRGAPGPDQTEGELAALSHILEAAQQSLARATRTIKERAAAAHTAPNQVSSSRRQAKRKGPAKQKQPSEQKGG
jgi:transcriptional regulator with XRE-family HTH domain